MKKVLYLFFLTISFNNVLCQELDFELYDRADSLLLNGKYLSAHNVYQIIEKEYKEQYPDIYTDIGHCYFASGMYSEAFKQYKKSIRWIDKFEHTPYRDTLTSEAYWMLAEVYFNRQRFLKALYNYELAISYAKLIEYSLTEFKIKYHLGYPLKEIQHLLDEYQSKYPDDPEANYYRGMTYYDIGAYDPAIDYFSKCMQKPECQLMLGVCQFFDDRFVECIPNLEVFDSDSITGVPKADLLHYLGTAHLNIGNLEESYDYLKRVLEIDDEYEMTYYRLGMTATRLNYLSEGEKYYRKAIEFDNNDHYYKTYLAHNLMKSNKIDQALEMIKASESINDTNYYTLLVHAQICLAMDNHDCAKRLLDRSIDSMRKADVIDSEVYETKLNLFFEIGDEQSICEYLDELDELEMHSVLIEYSEYRSTKCIDEN